jgi:uncharacterized cofD-like protein
MRGEIFWAVNCADMHSRLKFDLMALTALKKVVTIGGGTGQYTILSGLKHYPLDLTAVVAMADDGGSTGILRDEFGVLPPGDLRQCLVALSEADDVMRALFNYRYAKGDLSGHNFGNLFISTLEQITGRLDLALDVAAKILNIRGRVVPVTLTNVQLVAELKNGKVIKGQREFEEYQLVSKFGIKKMYLEPKALANPAALEVIREADLIVVGPGDLYDSILPNFLVPEISKALTKCKAKKVYVANLMNKYGHTDDFTVLDYVQTLEQYIGKKNVFDTIVYNTKVPAKALVRKYAEEGVPVEPGANLRSHGYQVIGADLLAGGIASTAQKDLLRRTLIRHDSDKLAKIVAEL